MRPGGRSRPCETEADRPPCSSCTSRSPGTTSCSRTPLLEADDARVLVDADGVVVLANAHAGDLLALPREALVGPRACRTSVASRCTLFQDAAVRAVVDNAVEVTVRDVPGAATPRATSHRVDLTLAPVQTDRGPLRHHRDARLHRQVPADQAVPRPARGGAGRHGHRQPRRGDHAGQRPGGADVRLPPRRAGRRAGGDPGPGPLLRDAHGLPQRLRQRAPHPPDGPRGRPARPAQGRLGVPRRGDAVARWRPRTGCWSPPPSATSPSAAGCRRRTTGSRTSSSPPSPTSCARR